MGRKRGVAWVGGAVASLLLAVVLVGQWITTGIDEFYSPGFHSASADHARERGVLLAPVSIADSVLQWRGQDYRVQEAWVEDKQQIYYRALFFRRDSLLNRPTLVVRIDGVTPRRSDVDVLCVALGTATVVVNGSTALTGTDCSRWFGLVQRPFPSAVALSVSERGAASHAAPDE